MTIEVTSFKAGDGDCFLVRCRGDWPFTILVDGGRSGVTDKLKAFLESVPENDRLIDLFVVTHIDADHIEGALEILDDATLRNLIGEVWFNYPGHKVPSNGVVPMTVEQGSDLVKLLRKHDVRWNDRLGGEAAIIWQEGAPNEVVISEETSIYILGPSADAFNKLKAKWDIGDLAAAREPQPAGLIAMGSGGTIDVRALGATKNVRDRSVLNGSSIVLLVRHAGRAVLLCGDTHPEDLTKATSSTFGVPLEIDLATVPHHGSHANTSIELARQIHARTWMISTDGSGHGHPSKEALSRILLAASDQNRRIELVFNHSHVAATRWKNEALSAEFGYVSTFAGKDAEWVTVNV